MKYIVQICSLVLFTLLAVPASSQNASDPGTPSASFPTLTSISMDWPIVGDDNENGQVSVRFRAQDQDWQKALNLRRVIAGSGSGFSWENKHSGSIFGLLPGTTYEIELSLEDSDGGVATETLEVSTRPIPTAPAGLTIVKVTPENIAAEIAAAEAGTIIEMAGGEYGAITFPKSGEVARPIILRGAAELGSIVNGDIRMDGRSHIWLEGVHVRGKIKFNAAADIVIRRMFVETEGDGIISFGEGVENAYVADNTVVGSTEWNEGALGVSGENLGEGIALTGPGNVIAYNRVSGFRDCVSLLEDDGAIRQFSIDIIGNDLNICADDAIEADFAMGNVRVIGNQMNNSFIAMSSQPSLGGPTYFIRNVAFNTVYQVFKPQRTSVGDIWLHNTSIKGGDALGVYTDETWSHAWFRNNLLIGGEGGNYNGYSNGSGDAFNIRSLDTATSSFDYDGIGVVGIDEIRGRFGGIRFASFSELTADTGNESNAVEVGLDVFATPPKFPSNPFPMHPMPDLSLAEGKAIDAGELLANINDGFSGGGPDLGAIEFGTTPHYGPRDIPVCGNEIVELGEACDDGNDVNDDGCSDCVLDAQVDPDMGSSRDLGMSKDMTDADAGNIDPRNEKPTPMPTIDGSEGCGCAAAPGSLPFMPFALLFTFFALRKSRKSN